MNAKELERLSVIQKIIDKRLTQILGSHQLGLTIRQVKRLVKKYQKDGAEGLVVGRAKNPLINGAGR